MISQVSKFSQTGMTGFGQFKKKFNRILLRYRHVKYRNGSFTVYFSGARIFNGLKWILMAVSCVPGTFGSELDEFRRWIQSFKKSFRNLPANYRHDFVLFYEIVDYFLRKIMFSLPVDIMLRNFRISNYVSLFFCLDNNPG